MSTCSCADSTETICAKCASIRSSWHLGQSYTLGMDRGKHTGQEPSRGRERFAHSFRMDSRRDSFGKEPSSNRSCRFQVAVSCVSKLSIRSLVDQVSRPMCEGYHRGGETSKLLVSIVEHTSRCSARYLSPLASKSDRHVCFDTNKQGENYPQIACLYAFIGPCLESWIFIRVVLGF